ncbi:MAG TPA: AI-2E family transporter [Pseudolysinimonas sp.]|nr:AI-2E family transporter [Pseudolysinimonas sp.]
MKIQNAFRLGLFGGLGVLVAILIGGSLAALATIITYVGAALFLALGIDPAVSFLERKKVPRWLAILIVLVGILGVFAGLVLAIIPVIADQVGNLIKQAPDIVDNIVREKAIEIWWGDNLSWLGTYKNAVDQVTNFFNDNLGTITSGVLNTVINIATGAFGAIIILILTLYFVASLSSIKRGLYQLIPATKREKFIDISEQITQSVGRYVIGQVTLGLANGILTLIFMTILGWILGKPIEYAALFAFLAFLFSLVPLVGTISGAVLISLGIWAFEPWPAVLIVVIYYLVYMQVEAYLFSPTVMNRAVKVPGVLVVVAALAGGTLLGILGALIAIPVAASVLLIIKQVIVPRQNEL